MVADHSISLPIEILSALDPARALFVDPPRYLLQTSRELITPILGDLEYTSAPSIQLELKSAIEETDRLIESGHPDRAVAAAELVISAFDHELDPSAKQKLAYLCLLKGIALEADGRLGDAALFFDEVVRRYAELPLARRRSGLQLSLWLKGGVLEARGLVDDAIAAYAALRTRYLRSSLKINALRPVMADSLLREAHLKRHRGDIDFYHPIDVLDTYFWSLRHNSILVRQTLAAGILFRQVAFERDHPNATDLSRYDRILADFDEFGLREIIARAMLFKALALRRAGLDDDAYAAFQAMLARFLPNVANESDHLKLSLAAALLSSAESKVNRSRAEIYYKVLEICDSTTPIMRSFTARALVNLAGLARESGHHQEAIETLRAVFARFYNGESTDVILYAPIAASLLDQITSYQQANDFSAIVSLSERIISCFEDIDHPSVLRAVAFAYGYKADALTQLGHKVAGSELRDKAVARFLPKATTVEELREPVAKFLVNRAVALGMRDPESFKIYEEVIDRFDRAADLDATLHEPVAKALIGIAVIPLADALDAKDISQIRTSLKIFSTVERRFTGACKDNSTLLEPVARAVLYAGHILKHLGYKNLSMWKYNRFNVLARASENEVVEQLLNENTHVFSLDYASWLINTALGQEGYMKDSDIRAVVWKKTLSTIIDEAGYKAVAEEVARLAPAADYYENSSEEHASGSGLTETELSEFRAFAESNTWSRQGGKSPSTFISETYRAWLDRGLSLKNIRDTQPKLAASYSAEVSRDPARRVEKLYVRPHRLPPGGTRAMTARLVSELTPEEKEKRRKWEREKKARQKAKRQPPPMP